MKDRPGATPCSPVAGVGVVPRRGTCARRLGGLGTARRGGAHGGVRDRHHHPGGAGAGRSAPSPRAHVAVVGHLGLDGLLPRRRRPALRLSTPWATSPPVVRWSPTSCHSPATDWARRACSGFSRARDRGRQRHFGVILDAVIAALGHPGRGVGLCHRPRPLPLPHPAGDPARADVLSGHVDLPRGRDRAHRLQRRAESRPVVLVLAGRHDVHVRRRLAVHVRRHRPRSSVAGRLLDLPYALAFVATGTMALHPSMRALTEPAGNRPQASSPGRIVLVAVALLVPALITLQHPSSSLQDRVALFTIIIFLTVAAVLRIVQALHLAERSEANLAYQAMHDSLTGLPNRRMMHQHLTSVLAAGLGRRHPRRAAVPRPRPLQARQRHPRAHPW